MSSKAPLLVTPKALQDLRSSSNAVSILDASWFMPNSPRSASKEFIEKRIPGARYLDLDEVAAPNELGLKHMMPGARVFADALETFGVTPASHVVLYDSQGIFSAPRALFMFRSFGHEKSSVLDGGLPRWETEGLPTETGAVSEIPRSTYPAPSLASENIRSYEQMVNNATKGLSDPVAEIVLDARSRGRYTGSDPEPRPGLSSGHMPHSFSLPFNAFLQTNAVPNSGTTFATFLDPNDLHRKLAEAVGAEYAQLIVEGRRSVTTTCGSGMTAGILWLGLKLIKESTPVALYDESWTGYALRPQSRIDKATS
ncbi:Rhodanese-like domain-containing protein [Russula earlei]|uniref:Rhodanese-like domain-containing protein n=1 Tax=Russula earlei TaxID=71964 RepID=A0ACC0UNL7_9AGAM|nr:Rhodanese-like domain-containing protein [Russula earlei]